MAKSTKPDPAPVPPPEEQNSGLYIMLLEEENVMRINRARIEPTPNGLTILTGANGEGKSSGMTGFDAALRGAIALPEVPLRKGAKKGRIGAIIGQDGKPVWYVEITITKAGIYYELSDKDGKKQSKPQQIMKELVGAGICFDPLEFMRLSPAKQRDQLIAALPELGEAIAKLETEKAGLKSTAQEQRAEKKAADGAFQKVEEPANPEVEIIRQSSADLIAEIREAEVQQRKLDDLGLTTKRAGENHENSQREVERLKKELAEAEQHVINTADDLERLQADYKAMDELPKADISALQDKLRNIEEHNRQADLGTAYRDARKAALEAEKALKETERRVDGIDEKREDMLAKAKMPIEGLSFTEDGLIFNGLPLSQASSSQQLRVSTAIAMSLNPKMRMILIRDGSLIDDNGIELMRDLTTQRGFCVIMERVGTNPDKGILFQDGYTPGLAPEPGEAEAPANE